MDHLGVTATRDKAMGQKVNRADNSTLEYFRWGGKAKKKANEKESVKSRSLVLEGGLWERINNSARGDARFTGEKEK